MTADAKSVETAISGLEASFKRLESSTAGLRAGLGAIVGGADPLDILKGSAENLLGSIPKIGPALQSGLMVGDSFFRKVRSTQEGILQTGEEASALGATVKGFSTLKLASENADALSQAMFILSGNIATAAIEGGKADEAFKALNLSSSELSALPVDESYLRVVGALNQLENSYLRTKLATDIFGKSAKAIKRDMEEGDAVLRKRQAHFADAGLGLNDRDVQLVKQADIEMKKFDATLEALWRRIAIRLTPAIADLGKDLQKLDTKPGKETTEEELKQQARLIQLKDMTRDIATGMVTINPFKQLELYGDALSRLGAGGAEDALTRVKAIHNAFKEANQDARQLGETGPGWLNVMTRAFKMAEAAFKDMDKLRAQEQEFWDGISKQGTAALDKIADPIETFKNQLMETQLVLQAMGAEAEQVDLAVAALSEEFIKAHEAQSTMSPALELGSAAEFSQRAKLLSETTGGTAEDKLAGAMQRAEQTAKERTRYLKEIAEAQRNLGLLIP